MVHDVHRQATSIDVLFGCFCRKKDGPGLPGGLIIYQGYLFTLKGHMPVGRFCAQGHQELKGRHREAVPKGERRGGGGGSARRPVVGRAFERMAGNGCGSKPMVPFWGRCTTHFSRDFSGDWDVHRGY